MATPMPAELRFESRHNNCALLNKNLPEATLFLPMIQILRRSRIFYDLTVNLVIPYTLVIKFWRTAAFRCDTVPLCISVTVNETEIVITEDNIRRVLRFDDNAHDRLEFGYVLLQGCFERMGYRGNLNVDTFNKKNIPPIWRFLAHVLIVCFSSRKVGFDSANQSVRSFMVALVLNKRYNFTRFVFNAMKSNITVGKQLFIMFPSYI